jgi:hypothetical protein
MASPPFCIKAYLSPWSLSLIGRIQKGGQGAIPFAPGRRRYSHAQSNEACALLLPPNFDLSGVHGALLQSHSLIFGAVGAIRSTIAGMHAPASEASPSGHDSAGCTTPLAGAMFASCDCSISAKSECSRSSRTRGRISRGFRNPALPTIEKGDALAEIRDRHRLAVESADFHRRSSLRALR